MSGIVLLRIALALVFAYSAVQKVVDPRRARAAAVDLGVPARLAWPGTILLVIAEVAVAAGLLIGPLYRVAAASAAALLAVLTVVLVTNLIRGNRPACACFGARSNRPIGPGSIVRNGILLAIAVVITVAPPAWSTALDRDAVLWTLVGVALLVATGSLVLVVHVLRRHGALLLRVEDLERRLSPFDDSSYLIDDAAEARETAADPSEPVFASAGGERLGLRDLAAGGATRVLLVDPSCPGCRTVLDSLGDQAPPGLAVASRDPAGIAISGPVVGYDDRSLPRRLGCPGVPSLVDLGPDGAPLKRHIGPAEILAALGSTARPDHERRGAR